jgi:hypothetical protein
VTVTVADCLTITVAPEPTLIVSVEPDTETVAASVLPEAAE